MIRQLYVVHHSHTDIGYTHGQSRIVRWHESFIRQAMGIAARRPDFSWTCETFYPVLQFWQHATKSEQQQLIQLARDGRIGLTAGFLHFNELPDAPLLDSLAERAQTFGRETNHTINSAMLADINGCPLIHARALARAGVRFMLTCVHPHHGYVPFGKRQHLFRWDLGDGQQLVVYHGDHYHTGNELGLSPGAESNYSAGFTEKYEAFDDDILERRLPAYLARMEESGWPYDFCVTAVSGLNTDNGPPSEAIADRISRWNARHQDQIRIDMITPDRLAEKIAALTVNLPAYTGDWPDWWADGVAGDPEATALFRSAQRDRRWLVAMSSAYPQIKIDLTELDQQLALYAEHTFGHSASVASPWNLLAQQLRLKKLGFAACAADQAETLIDAVHDQLGGSGLAYNRPPCFRMTNPYDHAIRDNVELELEGAELPRWRIHDHVRIINRATQQVLPHQPAPSMRGRKYIVDIVLAAQESVELAVEPIAPPTPAAGTVIVPDAACDVAVNPGDIPPTCIRTEHVAIDWNTPEGITHWRDVKTNRDLIHPQAAVAPFTLVAGRQTAPLDGKEQCDTRRKLGRNRNGPETQWAQSRLCRVISGYTGEHSSGVELDYTMEGCELVRLRLSARRHEPRVDVELILHKQGTWQPENMYVALPFAIGQDARLFLDRGFPMQPLRDQLPGTLCDYYGVQDGLAWCGTETGLAIAQHDSHLIQTGPLHYGIRLMSDAMPPIGPQHIYAWLMTNYWETNFSPELGGFYSFRFSVMWGEAFKDPNKAMDACRAATTPLHVMRFASVADRP